MRFERVIGDTVVSFGEVSLPSCEGKIASVVEIPVDSTNTYSGVLKKKDNIESVLNSLRNSIPFNYKKVDDNNIFISSETK